MQLITISGTLLADAEKCYDINKNVYIRFDVTCGETDPSGRSVYTHYHCTSYLTSCASLKRGDQVFVNGKFSAKQTVGRDGKIYMNLNIMVFQLSSGYRQEERNRQTI